MSDLEQVKFENRSQGNLAVEGKSAQWGSVGQRILITVSIVASSTITS